MLSNNIVGGMPGMDQLLQQHLLQLLMEQEQSHEEKKLVIRGVSWLREPLKKARDRADDDRASDLQADHSKAPPEIGDWTCPRCRSHRCMRANPGNVNDPVYCCAVCGYTFRKASASHLRESSDGDRAASPAREGA